MQMILEILAVAFVAAILSLFVGNLLAGTISSTMLRNNIIAEQNAAVETNITFSNLDALGFAGTAPPAEEMLENYDVVLSMPMVVNFLMTFAGIITIAAVVPTLYILRLNPRKIMT